ncbi:MAG: Biotin transporter BioY [Alphaproteobacteria bacterium MarineAlpha5_Bin11]|nr:BioY family protein [Pelagibacteraceae bacterium]PPR44333.1 MAG: Biotin transporter BioY [Alphaproteobacteria bacterium MarineAlpha5_Bin11]PPR51742.1 MAG: Biotin transporter BioY [Alphaproteobacteria bacterium MarineAlpha5_Bin10]|tara:strand:- start:12348 stop:12947 length:600 start_codon:yes stop_codon:yes gene_type:complete
MNNEAFISLIWPLGKASNLIRNLTLVFFGSLILILSAKIEVGWPIPMTMQTFVVYLLSITYGWKLASSTFLLYLLQGLKWPVFAFGGGVSYFITSPTVGFLYGMLAATLVIGILAEKDFNSSKPSIIPFVSIFRTLLPIILGAFIIFFFGLTYMSFSMGWEKSIQLGLKPFILSESIKIILAAILMPYAWKVVKYIKNK